MKGETAVLTIPIDVATALELLASDEHVVELVATGPGIEIRLTLAASMTSETTGPPPIEPPDPDTTTAVDDHICEHCGQTFKSAGGLGSHRSKTHWKNKPAPAPTPPAVIPCPTCERTFTTEHGLSVHTARVHKTLPPSAETANVAPIVGPRTCIEPGCTTRLSAYNKTEKCSVHDSLLQPPKFAKAADA